MLAAMRMGILQDSHALGNLIKLDLMEQNVIYTLL